MVAHTFNTDDISVKCIIEHSVFSGMLAEGKYNLPCGQAYPDAAIARRPHFALPKFAVCGVFLAAQGI